MDPNSARAKKRGPRPVALAMAATLLVLLAACGDGPEAAEDDTVDEPAEAAATDSDDPEVPTPAGEAGAGSELLAFSAETVGGDQFDGAELAGEPVALWFWAPW